jgi:hypothetical protein
MERRNGCLEAPLKKEETDARLQSGLAGWARRAWRGAAWGRGCRVCVLASCVSVGAGCRAGRRGRGAGWPSRSRQPGAGGGVGSSAGSGWASGVRVTPSFMEQSRVHLIHAPKKTTHIITECIEINVTI